MNYLAFLYGWLRKRCKMQQILWADWLLALPFFFCFLRWPAWQPFCPCVTCRQALSRLSTLGWGLSPHAWSITHYWINYRAPCLFLKRPWRTTSDFFTIGFQKKLTSHPSKRIFKKIGIQGFSKDLLNSLADFLWNSRTCKTVRTLLKLKGV